MLELRDLKDFKDNPTVYKKDFEEQFLKESEAFYEAEGYRLLDECDAPAYLRQVRYKTFPDFF
jgi:cullin 3